MMKRNHTGVNVRATWRFHRQAVQMQNWKKGMAASINGLTAFVNTMVADVSGMNADMSSATEAIDLHKDHINTVIDDLSDKVANYSGPAEPEYVAPPAFQVFISESQGSFSTVGVSPFPYDDVILNHGDHYDPSTGLFTTPVSGLYYVFATFTNTEESEAVIMVATPNDDATLVDYTTVCYMKFFRGQETACTTAVMMREGDTVGSYPFQAGTIQWNLPSGWGNTFGAYLIGRGNAADDVTFTTTTEAPTTITTSPP